MKLNKTVLSIPPYLSIAWKHVVALRVVGRADGAILVVELLNNASVEIPGLEAMTIEAIFAMHAKNLEERDTHQHLVAIPPMTEFGGMTTILHHDPDQGSLPPLPPVILEKIVDLTKSVMPDNATMIGPAEPHCQCPHCQIARAMHSASASSPSDEEVSEADLQFASWRIRQNGAQRYSVTSPLDEAEHYDVFLGQPVGCTCGMPHCEHIKAVLRS